MFKVYHRTWWKHNQEWPKGLEPQIGKSHFIDEVETEEEARALCKEWNNENDPGELSDKAEYEEC